MASDQARYNCAPPIRARRGAHNEALLAKAMASRQSTCSKFTITQKSPSSFAHSFSPWVGTLEASGGKGGGEGDAKSVSCACRRWAVS
ncbi:unnamed protein product [Colias eurytheme]|nr:unnamed protein product [Colias eurytheme]